jgi:hypothetical protein
VRTSLLIGLALLTPILAPGCSRRPDVALLTAKGAQMRNVLVHIDGFKKSGGGIV